MKSGAEGSAPVKVPFLLVLCSFASMFTSVPCSFSMVFLLFLLLLPDVTVQGLLPEELLHAGPYGSTL